METVPKFSVSDEIVNFVQDIIAKNNWNPVFDIKYQQGSAAGDGYFSRTVAVEIASGPGTYHLFLKGLPNIVSSESVPVEKLYENEVLFYKSIVPRFSKFVKDHNVKDGFRHVPTCFGTLDNKIIAMENLRSKGYTLFGRDKMMDGTHMTMVFKTFAKFHAVSFAFKDQHKEEFHRLTSGIFSLLKPGFEESPFAKMFKITIEEFLSKLDPIKDKDIKDKLDADDLIRFLEKPGESNEQSVITQGDSWCNNMMFLYEKNNPIDIVLIDWQILNHTSAILDLSFFFYTSASEESLTKLTQYMQIYHTELSHQIRQLGSDPDILYPFETMEKEWRKYCKYGYVIAFNHVKVMLSSQDEVMDMEKVDMDNMKNIFPKFAQEKEYTRRMKYLSRFMIKNNYV